MHVALSRLFFDRPTTSLLNVLILTGSTPYTNVVRHELSLKGFQDGTHLNTNVVVSDVPRMPYDVVFRIDMRVNEPLVRVCPLGDQTLMAMAANEMNVVVVSEYPHVPVVPASTFPDSIPQIYLRGPPKRTSEVIATLCETLSEMWT